MKIQDFDKDFYNVIEPYYSKKLYAEAVRNAILYIEDIIKKLSGLDYDGEKLINDAFSEKDPIIKINKCETTTEKDIQRSIYYIIRGLICGYRNPISHELNFVYGKREADTVLLLINNIILPKFDNSVNRINEIFDSIFINNREYSAQFFDSCISNIKHGQAYSLIQTVFRRLNEIKNDKYTYFILLLYNYLSSDERKSINKDINELLISDDKIKIARFFNLFPAPTWQFVDNNTKIKYENSVFHFFNKDYDLCNYKFIIDDIGKWIRFFENKEKIFNAYKNRWENDKRYSSFFEY